MDFEFPPDTLMLRDMLRRFVQKEARPLEMKYFNTGELTGEERARLRRAVEQLGLWGLTLPEEFGGGELDMVTACLIDEELGRTFIPVEIGEVTPLLYACREEQVTRFLEPALEARRRAIIAAREPGVNGTSPDFWTMAASRNGSGFILNGSKLITTFPEQDDFFIVFAWGIQEGLPAALTAFLIEFSGPGNGSALQVTRSKDATILQLQDYLVGQESILGEPGGALSLAGEQAPRAWIRLGARYVGLCERMIEMAVEYAKDWIAFGAPLSARPAIQRMLAEMRVEVESSRWLVYHAAWLVDQKSVFRGPAAQVRLATGEMLKRSVDRMTMIFAGPGPAPEIDPHRFARSLIPPAALELALEQARAAIAAEVLDLSNP